MNLAIEPPLAVSPLPTTRRFVAAPVILFIVPLSLVATAELLIALVDPPLGLAIHALLLLGLTLRAGLGKDVQGRRLALALTLAPLLRILSLALPLANLPQLAWYPIISVPLLVSALLVIRQLRMSRLELGLHPGNLLIQLMLMGGGLGIGAAEYALLGESQLIVAFSWNALTLLAVLLLLLTGFVEELIFRGLLQAAALPALGRWALIYVSLLFAALHIGYLSVSVVAFAFGLGLILACAARWGRSIMGVALAHGLANITLFILMPFLARQASGPAAVAIRSAIATGTLLAISALAFWLGRMIWQRRGARSSGLVTQQLLASPTVLVRSSTHGSGAQNMLPEPMGHIEPNHSFILPVPHTNLTDGRMIVTPVICPAPSQKLFFTALLAWPASRRGPAVNHAPVVPMIRALRRAAGITYVELAQRTQLPARLLAEIEHGLYSPNHDQLGRIFQALDVDMQQMAAA
jgi:uncharacterized protein